MMIRKKANHKPGKNEESQVVIYRLIDRYIRLSAN